MPLFGLAGGRGFGDRGRFGRCDERIDELPVVELRHRLVDTIFFWHPRRHEQSAADQVEKGQLAGEVLVIGVAFVGVVPVMELRRGNQPFQRPEFDARIGVDEHRLPLVDQARR